MTARHDELVGCVAGDAEVQNTFEKRGKRSAQGGGCQPVSQMIAQDTPAQGAFAFRACCRRLSRRYADIEQTMSIEGQGSLKRNFWKCVLEPPGIDARFIGYLAAIGKKRSDREQFCWSKQRGCKWVLISAEN